MKHALLAIALTPLTLLHAAEPDTASTAKVVDLRVESQTNPTTVNNPLPRFSWRIETEERGWLQKSYHILVASSPELLSQDKGDVWDSGKVPGRSTQFVPYQGPPLFSATNCHWKVRVTSASDVMSPWSTPATFTVQLSGPGSLPRPLFPEPGQRLSDFESDAATLDALFDRAAESIHEIEALRDVGLVLRGAAYHQSLLPRTRTWLNQLNRSVDESGFYPASLPSDGSFGSTQSDAAIHAAYVLWWMTGDRTIITKHWPTMYSYQMARRRVDPLMEGRPFGTLPADTLPAGDDTPEGFIHLTSEAINTRLLLEMGTVGSQSVYEMKGLKDFQAELEEAIVAAYLAIDSPPKIRSLSALLIAIRSGLFRDQEARTALVTSLIASLDQLEASEVFAQGPLVSANLLPSLSWAGQLDRAAELVKAQDPTKLSPSANLAISEWLISVVAGIGTTQAGFQNIAIQPFLPSADLIGEVSAYYDSPYGRIRSQWKQGSEALEVNLTIPANTTALVRLPARFGTNLKEGGELIEGSRQVLNVQADDRFLSFRLMSGSYQFTLGH